jgi:hypothetical protein
MIKRTYEYYHELDPQLRLSQQARDLLQLTIILAEDLSEDLWIGISPTEIMQIKDIKRLLKL